MSTKLYVIVNFPIYDQFGAIWSRIPEAQSAKLTFSLIVTFYLTKTKAELKNL